MKSDQKKLAVIAMVAGVLTTGCSRSQENNKKEQPELTYIYGAVLKEGGTIADRTAIIERSEGAIFGNESIRFGDSTYALKFRTDSREVYTMGVFETGVHLLEALNLAIEPGTRFRIPETTFKQTLNGKIGSIYDYQIEVL